MVVFVTTSYELAWMLGFSFSFSFFENTDVGRYMHGYIYKFTLFICFPALKSCVSVCIDYYFFSCDEEIFLDLNLNR